MEIKCPIRTVDLPGVPDLNLQGLIVVVGPNSSGKTQFLHDLNEAVCGKPREFVVILAIAFSPPPPFEEYLGSLLDRDAIRQSSTDEYLMRSLQYGADESRGSFRKPRVQSQYEQFAVTVQSKVEGSSPECAFLNQLGPLSCSALFLWNRLTLMDACPNLNLEGQSPSRTLQSLYWNPSAKTALHEQLARVFLRSIWVDHTRHPDLVLRVADSTELPSAEDRLKPAIMAGYRTIETEGDGLRSYTAICASLLLEQRPLCLIDEPEMCLHPPQAHAMGRFIGEHASDNNCTVVATHSSHILRGILETNSKAHVIRFTRIGSTFQARTLPLNLLEQATSKPRSRSEAILEGLLSDAVVLCEAEGDRIVYESTYRTFKDRRLDIRFLPSEGTGGFADPLRLYKILQIPTAVVADLDFLAKGGELGKVLTELGLSNDQVRTLSNRANEAVRRIRSSVSSIDPEAIQEELKSLAQTPIDLTNNEDMKLRGKLQRLAADLYRLRDLQQRGVEAIPNYVDDGTNKISLRSEVEAILEELKEAGLFLVPVGELESWVPILMRGPSREDKSQWAILAAEKIEDAGERDDDIWKFIHAVYELLLKRLETFAACTPC